MITEETYHGGSQYVTAASVTLGVNSPRVIAMAYSGAPTTVVVNLPQVSAARLDPYQIGGPKFIILKVTSQNVQVRKHDGTVLATLTSTAAAEVSIIDADANSWDVHPMTRGTPRNGGHGSMAAIPEEDDAYVLDPFCFEGDDCEYAAANPLDGEEGRDEVKASLFEDCVEYAKNDDREPVRAAQVTMPDAIVVRFFPGEFVADPLHPRAATTLSDAFYTILENDGNPHRLEYNSVASFDGASHNPYHARLEGISGVAWFLSALNVTRKVWQKIIEYSVDGTTHTIEIRFVMETQSDESPLGQATNGMWGSLFMLYVFATEIHPTFVEGGNFQPVGFSTTNAFTRNDPILWGGADGVAGGSDAAKGCHPQLALAAAIVTTYHSPFRSRHVPLRDRMWVNAIDGGDERGYNREYSYRRANCSPWVTNPTRDEEFCADCGDLDSAFGITNFGTTVGGTNAAAMTRGGSFPLSTIPDSLCFENGLAQGVTYLIPQQPGWDEEIGQFDGVASASISICVDADGWPEDPISPCDGFPGDKLGDVGGSHHCFRNDEDSATRCCTTIVSTDGVQYYTSQGGTEPSLAYTYEVCRRFVTVLGPRVGSDCSVVSTACEVTGQFFTQRVIYIDDYTYQFGGNQLLRQLDWKRHVPDPDQVLYSDTYASGAPDYVQEVGTWSLTATIDVTAASAGETAKAVLLYEPAGSAYRDMTVSGTAKKATMASHGLIVRGSVSVGDDLTGYVGIVTPTGTGTGTVAIKYYNAGTATTLASANIALANDTVDLVFDVWGNDLTLDYEVSGGVSGSLTAQHCGVQENGYPGMCTESNSTNVRFQDWVVLDTNVNFIEITASIGYQNLTTTFPAAAKYAYNQCTGTYNPDCGTCCEPERCNCTTWTYDTVSATTASWTSATDVSATTDPTYCGGPYWNQDCYGNWCAGFGYYCGKCPLPFPCLSICIQSRCLEPGAAEPSMCTGLTKWCSENAACS